MSIRSGALCAWCTTRPDSGLRLSCRRASEWENSYFASGLWIIGLDDLCPGLPRRQDRSERGGPRDRHTALQAAPAGTEDVYKPHSFYFRVEPRPHAQVRACWVPRGRSYSRLLKRGATVQPSSLAVFHFEKAAERWLCGGPVLALLPVKINVCRCSAGRQSELNVFIHFCHSLRAKLDKNSRLQQFCLALERACVQTVEAGLMPKDLAICVKGAENVKVNMLYWFEERRANSPFQW